MSARIGRCFAQLTEAGQEEANERSHYEAYELKTHHPTLICIDIKLLHSFNWIRPSLPTRGAALDGSGMMLLSPKFDLLVLRILQFWIAPSGKPSKNPLSRFRLMTLPLVRTQDMSRVLQWSSHWPSFFLTSHFSS